MSSATKKQSSVASIQSVQRAAAILKCFTQTDTDLGVTTLSQQLGLHKSTVSRLLSTLQQEGFVEQDPETGKYRLGLGLVTLAGIVLDRIDLPKIAAPHLNALAELTQETVTVAVLNGNECVNVGGVASPRPIQYVGRIGRRTPTHCTAAGKILLAYLTPQKRQEILPKELPYFTDNTIVNVQTLEQVLVQVREQGYAIAHEEHQPDLSAIAAPIYDHTASIFATVVVSGPTYRLGPGQIETFAEPIKETAHKISAQLGFASAG